MLVHVHHARGDDEPEVDHAGNEVTLVEVTHTDGAERAVVVSTEGALVAA